jgi:hypothetical protein
MSEVIDIIKRDLCNIKVLASNLPSIVQDAIVLSRRLSIFDHWAEVVSSDRDNVETLIWEFDLEVLFDLHAFFQSVEAFYSAIYRSQEDSQNSAKEMIKKQKRRQFYDEIDKLNRELVGFAESLNLETIGIFATHRSLELEVSYLMILLQAINK